MSDTPPKLRNYVKRMSLDLGVSINSASILSEFNLRLLTVIQILVQSMYPPDSGGMEKKREMDIITYK